MRVLIVGGTGLISTSISRQLMATRPDVELWHFNRGKSGPKVPLPGEPKLITGDRKNAAEFVSKLREGPVFDVVIDMIGFLPEEAESLVAACKGRVKQLIFCSTVDVYNKPASRYPITEDEGHSGLNAYGKAKVVCEKILSEAHQRGDFALTVIRPAHTYGEGGSIINSLLGNRTYLDRIKKGKPVIMHGDGTALWVSCHVDDVAKAFIGAIGNEKTYGQSYHTAGEEWMTWNQYTDRISEAAGLPPPRKVYIPSDLLMRVSPERAGWCQTNFYMHNIFDNSRARADLGFEYTISFLEGMKRTIKWMELHQSYENSDDDAFYDALLAAWEQASNSVAAALKGIPELR
jgi:nucleoside-diphosphate-sugar epimerase